MIYAAPGAAGAKVVYTPQYNNFIGGQWVPPVKGQYFDVVTPVSGQVYTRAARSTAEESHDKLLEANAYLEGRNYVIPDDVCAVFPDVCVHRLILNAKARLQEYTAAQILQNILTSVQKPDIREFTDK